MRRGTGAAARPAGSPARGTGTAADAASRVPGGAGRGYLIPAFSHAAFTSAVQSWLAL